MSAIYINEERATSILNMDIALELCEEAFRTYNSGKSFNMARQRMRIRKGALHILPAAIPYKSVMGLKLYTSFRNGIIFKVHLYSAETGEPLAIIDAAEIGRLRTGAASGVASKYLAKKNSSTMFIFGGGFQAEAQVEAIVKSTSIKEVIVATRSKESADKFAATISEKYKVSARSFNDLNEDLLSADIITTITTSNKPLFDGSLAFENGVHINSCGANALIRAEVPEKVIEKGKVVVDSKDVALVECGDILPLLEKGRLHWNEVLELGEVVNDPKRGRESDKDITIFESQGMGLQDIICAEYIYKKALESGSYEKLPF